MKTNLVGGLTHDLLNIKLTRLSYFLGLAWFSASTEPEYPPTRVKLRRNFENHNITRDHGLSECSMHQSVCLSRNIVTLLIILCACCMHLLVRTVSGFLSSYLPRRFPTLQRLYHSASLATVTSGNEPAMFKKAVNDHQAELAKQLFPSSSPTSPAPTTKQSALAQQNRLTFPLSKTSGNKTKQNAPQPTATAHIPPESANVSHALKRTSSGLAKAFHSNDPFKEAANPPVGSQAEYKVNKENVKPKTLSQPIIDAVWIDEDDFDSDIDLDVEDPSGKGSISYPSLPQKVAAASRAVLPSSAVTYAPEQSRATTQASVDSGYQSQFRPSSEVPSFSNTIAQFAYPHLEKQPSKVTPYDDEAARPAKRRTLPWLQQQTDENEMHQTSQQPKKVTGAFTPLPKNTKASSYPWNTTASAIKEQQKNFKQTNKSLVRANQDIGNSLQDAATTRKKQTVAKLLLSHEQKHILDLVVQKKKSVFFTGSAGTGKSVLLRQIIQELRKTHIREPDRVAIAASTGLAACNIGGVTLHSFAGIGLGKDTVEEHVKKIKKNTKARHRWLRTKILIVDEISMIDGDLFDKLEQIARVVRNNGRPFGGIQLVITGDFFQLPPVTKTKTPKFAFDANTWNTAIEYTIGLHHVFRQKDPGKCLLPESNQIRC